MNKINTDLEMATKVSDDVMLRLKAETRHRRKGLTDAICASLDPSTVSHTITYKSSIITDFIIFTSNLSYLSVVILQMYGSKEKI